MEDILDHFEKKKEYRNYKIGKSFAPPAIYAGYAFLLMSVYVLFTGQYGGIGLLILGGFLSFTYSGILLDIKGKEVKEYISYFGYKKGKWMNIDKYPFLTVLGRTQSYKAYSRVSAFALTDKQKFFDICLLSNDHRKKLMIKRLKNKEQATIDAKEIATSLGIQFTTYNPVVSAKTRARRR